MQVVGAETDNRDETDDDRYDIDWIKIHTVTDAPVENTDPFAKDLEFAKSLSGVHPNKKRSMTAMRKRYENESGDVGSKMIEDDIITGYNAFEVVLPPYNLDYLSKLYELSTPHQSAVDAKVANIVGLGYDFIPNPRTKLKMDSLDGDKSSKYNRKLAKWKVELGEALDDLNSEDTFSEILTKVWKDYETTGNGYLEIGRSITGQIKYLGHLPCATVRVRRERDGFVQIISNKAVFFRNFGKDDPDPIKRDSNPNEVIHFKRYSPSSTFYGVPAIVSAKSAVAGNKFAADFNIDYFENKAVPRHVIILQGATINPRLAKNILEFFETGLKGKNHRSLFVPLPAGTKDKKVELRIEPVEAGIQDGSFAKYRKDNIDEILMAHRVPINKLSLPAGVSLAAAASADKTFKEQVVGPEQDVLDKKLSKFLKALQGENAIFDIKMNELTLTDENTQSQIDERRIKTGQRTSNELRVRDGMNEHPEGNELFDMNAAKKLAEMSDKTTRRGQDKSEAAAKEQAKAAPAAGANANGNPAGTRQRDTERSAARTDSNGTGRSPKGEGRTNGTG